MPVSFGGITLPEDIQWIDEFSGFGVGQIITPSLTGALVVEEFTQTEGRPITLQSGEGSWTDRSIVEQLYTLQATALASGVFIPLVWSDGTIFDVVIDRSRGGGFEAREVYRREAPAQLPAHPYFISLPLLIKGTQ